MDIVEQLRECAKEGDQTRPNLVLEAANEIERLRGVLRVIGYGPPDEGEPIDLLNQFVDLARAALKESE